MVRFTIGRELVEKLLSTNEMVELCDESGRLIRCIPAGPTQQDTKDPWSFFPELTTEEIDRRCNEPGEWLSTDEAIAYLKDRGNRK